jgi:hypothetical protein
MQNNHLIVEIEDAHKDTLTSMSAYRFHERFGDLNHALPFYDQIPVIEKFNP